MHPRCNTEGMTLHLAEISAAVAPGAHAVLLLDQAGWHGSRALVVPGNITLMPLPPQCPEVNPVVWRRVVLPVATSLATLQRIVQLCMGWQNGDGAVERFRLHGEYPSGLSPLSGFALWPGERFGYDYGGWRCQIRLEKLVAAPSHGYPVCIAGQRSRPARATRQRLGVYDISAQVSLGV